MRKQVCIIGGGPSGLLLGQLLHGIGIDAIVLERQSRAHVLGRIRAGILERGMVSMMAEAGVDARLRREGFVHDGVTLSWGDEELRIDFTAHTDTPVVVYGQTEVTRDLYEARDAAGAETRHGVENVRIHDAGTDQPYVTWTEDGRDWRCDCDFVAGCDGFHGVSRQSIPAEARREFEKVYPFGWLGILSETPPVHHELIYSGSDAGFALCSMRNENLSRYYVQVPAGTEIAEWSDARFWDALRAAIPARFADSLQTGPSIEKSIAPLRSFVCEPMQWGRLFLVGDAAHIVPPTGAKGLNTAASDVHYLFTALRAHYLDRDATATDQYGAQALARVWKAVRFSWWMTTLLHRFPDQSDFDLRIRRAELEHLAQNLSQQKVLAQNYVGLPY